MKTAILFSGQLRTLDKCIQSIQKHIFSKVVNYDVFASVSEDENSCKIGLLHCKNHEILPPPLFSLEDYEYNNLKIKDIYGRNTRHMLTGITGLLRQYWYLKKVDELKQEEEKKTGKEYDWVIRIRPDLYFLSDIEDLSSLDNNLIYIPKFSNFYGYNDRFAFGNSKNMEVYNNRINNMNGYKEFHPETILKQCLDSNNIGIGRTNIHFWTYRENEKHTYPVFSREFGDIL